MNEYTQFEDQQISRSYDTEPKGVTGWLIKKRIVKSTNGASMLLVVISVIALVISFFLFNGGEGYQEVKEDNFVPAEL